MSGPSFDTVIVRYAEGAQVTVGTPAAENSRQGFVEESSLTSVKQAIHYGEAWLASHGSTIDQHDLGILPTDGDLVPWTGRTKGDAIGYRDREGTPAVGRIYGVGFTGLRRNGTPNYSYTIGSAAQERAVKSQQTLTKITQGSMRGTFGASTISPAPSFGGVGSGALPHDTIPVADTDEFRLDEPYDRTRPVPFDEAKAIIRVECAAESLVGSDASRIEIWRVAWSANGTIIAADKIDAFTWPGTVYRYTHITELQYGHGQGYQLRNVAAPDVEIRTDDEIPTYRAAGAHHLITVQAIASTAN